MTNTKENKKAKGDVGVVIVTHGNFGAELLRAVEVILGPQRGCKSVGVDVNRGVDQTMAELRDTIQSVDAGSGVLALTDLFGGSPTTLSLSLLKHGNLEVITGVNLPMVVATLQARSMPLEQLAERAATAAAQGVKIAGEMLRKRAAKKKGAA